MITIRLGVILKPKSNHIYVGLLASSFILLFVLFSDFRFSWVGPGSPLVRLLFIPFLSARTLLWLLSKGNTTCRSRLWFISVNVILTLNVFLPFSSKRKVAHHFQKIIPKTGKFTNLSAEGCHPICEQKRLFCRFASRKQESLQEIHFLFREKKMLLSWVGCDVDMTVSNNNFSI